MKQENVEQKFVKLDLPNGEHEGKSFEQCKFEACNFSHSQFIRCEFIDCEFVRCDLNLIDVKLCRFTDVVFDECKMLGINWTRVAWPQIELSSPVSFYRCNISDNNFFGLKLANIVIEDCRVSEADFRETDLSGANLAYSDFSGSLFMHTKLNRADFSESVNYSIDIEGNEITDAKFSFPEVVSLLKSLPIEIQGFE